MNSNELNTTLYMTLGLGIMMFFALNKLKQELEATKTELVHVKSAAMGVRG